MTVLNRLDRSRIAGWAIFGGLSDAEIDGVLQSARLRRWPKGTTVFRQGEDAAFFSSCSTVASRSRR